MTPVMGMNDLTPSDLSESEPTMTSPAIASTDTRPATPYQHKMAKDLMTQLAEFDAIAARTTWHALRTLDESGKLTYGILYTVNGNMLNNIKAHRANQTPAIPASPDFAPSHTPVSPAPYTPPARTDWAAKRAHWDASIPVGNGGHFYAGVQLSTDSQVRYYRVTRTARGMWFVHMYVSDNTVPVRGFKAAQVLDAIALAPREAGKVYADNFTRCMDCNRRLTDEESIALGIGPVCAGRH